MEVLPGEYEPLNLPEHATYWVAGGLGGFGFEIAKWLVARGARHLVLSGRNAVPSEEATDAIAVMQKQGARIHCISADLTKSVDVQKVVMHIDDNLPPLKGVFHTAMVLEDKLLVDLDLNTLHRVLKPKTIGGWNLHWATRKHKLDHFVLFSSLSSVFGHAGQANYSAANAFLDSLAYLRRANGLPGLVMNWGHLGETGYLARRKQLGERLERQGVLSFTVKQALECLEYAMQLRLVQLSVLRMDWTLWRGLGVTTRVSPRFAHLLRNASQAGVGSASAQMSAANLREVNSEARTSMVHHALVSKVSHLLGIPEGQLPCDTPLLELGLDSLMAVELRNWIEAQMEINVPISVLMRGGTIVKLTKQVCDAVDGEKESSQGNAGPEEVPAISSEQANNLLAQLPDMSDDQVSELLAKMMNQS